MAVAAKPLTAQREERVRAEPFSDVELSIGTLFGEDDDDSLLATRRGRIPRIAQGFRFGKLPMERGSDCGACSSPSLGLASFG
jgi:hypothetical protein